MVVTAAVTAAAKNNIIYAKKDKRYFLFFCAITFKRNPSKNKKAMIPLAIGVGIIAFYIF